LRRDFGCVSHGQPRGETPAKVAGILRDANYRGYVSLV
jgi:hypothetical protein